MARHRKLCRAFRQRESALRPNGEVIVPPNQPCSSVYVSGTRVNPLTLLGLFAVSAMLVCYALENRSRWFILAFAAACALASVYGFLQGALPFRPGGGGWGPRGGRA